VQAELAVCCWDLRPGTALSIAPEGLRAAAQAADEALAAESFHPDFAGAMFVRRSDPSLGRCSPRAHLAFSDHAGHWQCMCHALCTEGAIAQSRVAHLPMNVNVMIEQFTRRVKLRAAREHAPGSAWRRGRVSACEWRVPYSHSLHAGSACAFFVTS
jgi:hypothetical protein